MKIKATITKGSLKIVSIGRNGVEKITPVYCFDPCATLQLANLAFHSNCAGTVAAHQLYHHHAHSVAAAVAPSFLYPSRLLEPTTYAYPALGSHPRIILTGEGKLPSHSVAWSRFRPVRFFHDGTVCGLTANPSMSMPLEKDIAYTADIGGLLQNRSVIARSTLDGYYYKGKVMSQVGIKTFDFYSIRFD